MEQLVVKVVKDFSKDQSESNLVINVEETRIVKWLNITETGANIVDSKSVLLVEWEVTVR